MAELPLAVVRRYLGPTEDRLEHSGAVHFISGAASAGPKNCWREGLLYMAILSVNLRPQTSSNTQWLDF